MKKLLVLIPWLIALLACNLGVSTTPVFSVTPTLPATATFTPPPPTDIPLPGTITGRLSYPSEFLPAMRVVAFSLIDGKAYFVDTAQGERQYSIDVPPGTYYVVSYSHQGNPGTTGQVDSYEISGGAFAGGYSQMVPCGLSVGCDDHSLIPVTVESGKTATADPGDWYAPEGTFPPMPNP